MIKISRIQWDIYVIMVIRCTLVQLYIIDKQTKFIHHVQPMQCDYINQNKINILETPSFSFNMFICYYVQ